MRTALCVAALGLIPAALGADILKTDGVTSCSKDASIKVDNVDIQYDRSNNIVTFDVSGSSDKEQNVTASLIVTAYGRQVYQKDFDPCDQSTKVDQLCPVPARSFFARGNQTIPSNYASMIPSIAFSIPNVDAQATMKLKAKDGGEELACIQSNINNGKTIQIKALPYAAATIAGAALLLSGLSAIGAGGQPGSTSASPSFTQVFGFFQTVATTGMYSVNYPSVVRSWSTNFAFSTGLITWNGLQTSIDNFRQSTGGNLTHMSVQYLHNATLVFNDGSSNNSTVARRAVGHALNGLRLMLREDLETGSGDNSTGKPSKTTEFASGIKAYSEQLMIPSANTFMTVLLIFSIVIATICVSILLFKVILETWALIGKFPKSLTRFRKEYWFIMARTITNLILLLYGVWTLYCVFQFTHGDSWAAKLLAALTLGIFTAVLGFYILRIYMIVQKSKKLEGDASALYEDKSTWLKYRIFYENYKKGYYWLFVPAIVYMFAKGCVLAAGDGHGTFQTAGQLIIESLMLIVLLWSRPYNTKSGNWINLVIQVVRVLSVVCILVFVEQLGISQTTKTVTGVVLIAVQASLTGVLAILIAINSIITLVRMNPHRRRRKEAGKPS